MNITPATPQSQSKLKIQVWIDFVCPYCLLGKTVIHQAIEGLNVEIEWMPFELRPFPNPARRPEDDYLPAAWETGVYPTAKRIGVDIKLPTVSPQPYTRAPFLGLQYAAQQGKGDEYVDAVLRAFFQEDQNVGDIDVLKRILSNLGLHPDDLDEVLGSPEAHAQHEQALLAARASGIRAVPSIAVGEVIFPGTPDAATLRAAVLKSAAVPRRGA